MNATDIAPKAELIAGKPGGEQVSSTASRMADSKWVPTDTVGHLYNQRGLIGPSIRQAGRFVKRFLGDPAFRELQRLHSRIARLPRCVPGEVRVFGEVPLRYVDAASVLSAFDEIFVNRIYDFGEASDRPYIIDAGGNIGLGVLYWKRRYSGATGIVFEPDPAISPILEANIKSWDADFEVIRAALSDEEGQLFFEPDGADGGRLCEGAVGGGEETDDLLLVPTVSLRPWLNRPVDLLKIDIEGAEATVLEDIATNLDQVARVFVECHSFSGTAQPFATVYRVLEDAGFRCFTHVSQAPARPFSCGGYPKGELDHNFNLFAVRPGENLIGRRA